MSEDRHDGVTMTKLFTELLDEYLEAKTCTVDVVYGNWPDGSNKLIGPYDRLEFARDALNAAFDELRNKS